jgi:hypothetical protein
VAAPGRLKLGKDALTLKCLDQTHVVFGAHATTHHEQLVTPLGYGRRPYCMEQRLRMSLNYQLLISELEMIDFADWIPFK